MQKKVSHIKRPKLSPSKARDPNSILFSKSPPRKLQRTYKPLYISPTQICQDLISLINSPEVNQETVINQDDDDNIFINQETVINKAQDINSNEDFDIFMNQEIIIHSETVINEANVINSGDDDDDVIVSGQTMSGMQLISEAQPELKHESSIDDDEERGLDFTGLGMVDAEIEVGNAENGSDNAENGLDNVGMGTVDAEIEVGNAGNGIGDAESSQDNDDNEKKEVEDEIAVTTDELSFEDKYPYYKQWNTCCRTWLKSSQMFGIQMKKKQKNCIERHVKRSLVPTYVPCPQCAHQIDLKYSLNGKKGICDCINFSSIDSKQLLQRKPAGHLHHIRELSLKDLIKIAFTVGALDFAWTVMNYGLSGKVFYECLINNKSVWINRKLIYREVSQIINFFEQDKLCIMGCEDCKKILLDMKRNPETYEKHKLIDLSLKKSNPIHTARMKATDGLFGKLGEKHGIRGAKHPEQKNNAKIGKELGGRKKGGHNTLDVTIEFSFLSCA